MGMAVKHHGAAVAIGRAQQAGGNGLGVIGLKQQIIAPPSAQIMPRQQAWRVQPLPPDLVAQKPVQLVAQIGHGAQV